MQYNKRDLEGGDIPILSIETLEHDLNRQLKVPYFEASATAGTQIIATMKKIVNLTMGSLEHKFE